MFNFAFTILHLDFLPPQHGLSNDGIPHVNIDQLNPWNLFSGFEIPPLPIAWQIGQLSFDGDIFNFISHAMRLLCGKSRNGVNGNNLNTPCLINTKTKVS
jgi:hypothetical protein